MEYICVIAEWSSRQAEIGTARVEQDYKGTEPGEGLGMVSRAQEVCLHLYKYMDSFFPCKKGKAGRMDISTTKIVDLVVDLWGSSTLSWFLFS